MLPAFSALDLVQDSLRRVLADGMAGITRMIIVIRRPLRSAISSTCCRDRYGGRPTAEARKDPGSYGFISCRTGLTCRR
jgi:hypothetical protein